ncbi:MAG: HlyD family efflux transporter periplasmic adaptor subunit [Bacteroidales bacterium]|jgi:multidrug resistance efflux pump|nr:HlyD family efflux transporter periplasmic adaptor subunit [Bacteroidales bacterium]
MNSLIKFNYFLLILIAVGLNYGCKTQQREEVPVVKVIKGDFYIELYEEGELEAINSTNIMSPNIPWRYGDLKITQIVKDGTEVHTGDTLVVFDPTEVRKSIVDAEARLEMSLAELERMEVQHASDMEELRADMEVTRLSYEISKIRFESAAYESDVRKKEIELNLDRAGIALDRIQEQIDNRLKIQKEEIKQKNLSINQDRNRLREAFETLDKLHLISPSPGIAIINRNWTTGNKFQIGDQCWSGFPLIQLPDLSALRANVKINEVDIAKIKDGLPVEIRPDAFSERSFKGVVHKIANLAVNKDSKSKVKVFPVEINIHGTDEKLLPGLTVSCRIELGKIENALCVPVEAIKAGGDQSFVFKQVTGGFEKIPVLTGESNKNYVVIIEGLGEDDHVALMDPFADKEEEDNADQKTE